MRAAWISSAITILKRHPQISKSTTAKLLLHTINKYHSTRSQHRVYPEFTLTAALYKFLTLMIRLTSFHIVHTTPAAHFNTVRESNTPSMTGRWRYRDHSDIFKSNQRFPSSFTRV
ncbi:hypothetical protein CDAR_262501 [Caerostris darwini]|uniref:Uncharacterized protein n=1 Tax=Caerostris darwini TaxID=1538125 RepID=A0AAV4TXW1_9ARAC|nr:hypothetical protein CDAR_262501 [Caerostris darwini]